MLYFDEQAEQFWEKLSKEDKLKAFYAIMKRVHEGEIEMQASYRYILYQIFGFDKDAYALGMDCGFFELHNSIAFYSPLPQADSAE